MNSVSIILKALCLLFLLELTHGAALGLVANVSTICGSGCDWNNPLIWTEGYVPTAADTVDIQEKGTYTIRVNVDVSIQDFDLGTDDQSDGRVTLEILSGFTFRSAQQVNTFLTSTLTVNAGASLICDGQSTNQGIFNLRGFASFGGARPSLQMNTYDGQLSTTIIYARLFMTDGTLVVANDVAISAKASLYGSGLINGTLQLRGTLQPGGEDTVGTLNVTGDLVMESSAETYIDLASSSSFDHVYIGKTTTARGDLFANLISDYEPLSHTEFIFFNHTRSTQGFEDIRGTSLLERFRTKWQVMIDQEYTALVYDDAATILISFTTIAACLFFTLL